MEGNSTLEEFGKNLGSFRFVVLEHKLPPQLARPSHWDLLLEQPPEWGGMLLTFEVSNPPAEWGSPTAVLKLPDHRPLYLDYEGPISGNRGSIKRVLEGNFRWLEKTDELLSLSFHPAPSSTSNNVDSMPQGVLKIRKNPADANLNQWEMEWMP